MDSSDIVAASAAGRDTVCTICYQHVDRLQKLVPCGHSLCKGCVRKLEQVSHVRSAKRCPFCRQDFTVVQSPPGLVELCMGPMMWRLPKPTELRRLPPKIRALLLGKLRNGRLIYGENLIELLRGLSVDSLVLRDASNMRNADLEIGAPLLATPPRSIVASNSPMLRDDGVRALLRVAAPVLEYLDLNCDIEFEGECLQEFGQKLPKLDTLNLSGCKALQSPAVASLAQGCASTLTTVDLGSCHRLDDDTVLGLSACQLLVRLRLYGLWKISTQAIVRLLGACRQLRALDLTHCSKLCGAEVLRAIAAHTMELRELAIGGVPGICDDEVVALGMSDAGARLECLQIPKTEITSESLRALKTHCGLLQRLDISECHEVTEDALLTMIMEMPRLRICQLKYCKGIATQMQLYVSQLLAGRMFGVDENELAAPTCGARITSGSNGGAVPLAASCCLAATSISNSFDGQDASTTTPSSSLSTSLASSDTSSPSSSSGILVSSAPQEVLVGHSDDDSCATILNNASANMGVGDVTLFPLVVATETLSVGSFGTSAPSVRDAPADIASSGADSSTVVGATSGGVAVETTRLSSFHLAGRQSVQQVAASSIAALPASPPPSSPHANAQTIMQTPSLQSPSSSSSLRRAGAATIAGAGAQIGGQNQFSSRNPPIGGTRSCVSGRADAASTGRVTSTQLGGRRPLGVIAGATTRPSSTSGSSSMRASGSSATRTVGGVTVSGASRVAGRTSDS